MECLYYTYGSTANFLSLGSTALIAIYIIISKERRCNEGLSRVRWSPVIIGPAGPSIAEIYGLPSSCAIARSPTTVAPARRRARAASLHSTAPVFISKLHLIFITRRQFIGRHGWSPRTVHDDIDGPGGLLLGGTN